MNPVRTIRGLLLTAAVVFSVALFLVVHSVVSHLSERSVRESAVRDAHTFAEVTFNSMFQLMSTGWTRAQLEGFIAAIGQSVEKTETRITIFRGERVSALFGALPQNAEDHHVRRAFDDGQVWREDAGADVRVLYPLRAQAVCLRCHVNAAEGDVLGVIDVRQNVESRIDATRGQLTVALLPVLPVAVLLTLLMTYFIRRRLDGAIGALTQDIQSVNRIADLKQLEAKPVNLGFAEFNRVGDEIKLLTERVRNVAVDKDMLEFEIRLLEKFILTSDVIKDWREYVNRLLVEIDAVMPAYALFSIFKIGNETFDLEVFWRHTPPERTRRIFEDSIREALNQHEYFAGGYAVRIEHHVADASIMLGELSNEDVELQTKSLLVDAPKIGGIVGIGMQAQAETDATRLLVIESILSTLLNVVGSVKAIDKYTKDLEYYATRDPLTNLYNQRVFWELLESEATRSARHAHKFVVLMVDADNFKVVNDSYGHGFGDVFLQEVAASIRGATRDDDMVARYGGDEFALILPETDLQGACEVSQRILRAVESLSIETPKGDRISGSVSIGMAAFPDHALGVKDLFLFADNMLYRAKADGKGRMAVPSEQDLVEVFRTLGEKSIVIQKAVDARGVLPCYQPIINVQTGQVEAMEVLSRIRLDNGQLLVADEYVAIAEQMGLMYKLDYVLMERTLEAAVEAKYDGLLFMNMSPRALVLNDFVQEARRIAQTYGVDPSRIVLEITERETIKNMALLERFIHTLRAEGFKLAIDDFGSGFSSFHYVKRFPIDFLKIEGDFILGLKHSDKDRALVRSIVSLAQDLGIRTVAEFVEDAGVLAAVADKHIDLAQGYHIRRPSLEIRDALANFKLR